MSPRSQHAIMVAALVVGIASVAGIAALEGWVTLPVSEEPAASAPPATPRPRIAATPSESLLPGETIVEAPPPAAPPVPAAQPAPPPPPAPAPEPEPRRAKRSCPNCGEITSTTYRQFDSRGAWEVRVRFDDGTRASLRYPTDPGFRVGERVVMASGRLKRE